MLCIHRSDHHPAAHRSHVPGFLAAQGPTTEPELSQNRCRVEWYNKGIVNIPGTEPQRELLPGSCHPQGPVDSDTRSRSPSKPALSNRNIEIRAPARERARFRGNVHALAGSQPVGLPGRRSISRIRYLYVALVRDKKSRCGVKSTIEPSAGPANGLAFIASPKAALALSKPAEVGQM
jgi:hypothetical protein